MKFPLVVVMFVSVFMSLVLWKVFHGPLLLLLHVAFIVSPVLLSTHIMCRLGIGHMFVVVFAGVSVWSCSHGFVFAGPCVVNV